ncbi:flagellar type III secretion system pore protein FliP [Acetobacter sp.]|jgi:flagellar biosynthetic protein FliP|uniref:flagellar type III secretion system pore protein FliP n=1 Tax=Acetobacter sp. TaxID=440 RepID=UPI0025C0C8BA|nr:flagellar type III secretion system pore protein FliP [Acetobacter sp.]MCH4091239.1 flagellar type III secretion system pore protein FliP [Acetobacter sp.]MCI1300866.1 flagellar type III secretion system pore protein FliP [Acetobacter sp.]MCI1317194.1 flagellar type III secretion system pore protein FliP [Acetobacter sp.]
MMGAQRLPFSRNTTLLALFSLAGLTLLGGLLLAVWPGTAHAQAISLDLGQKAGPGTTGRLVQLSALITVISLAPSLLVMVTAFTRIIIVLSLLRGAIGAQGTPPNTVLIGLALFLTFFVMQPVFEKSWEDGISPLINGSISEMDGIKATAEPFRTFMLQNTRSADLATFASLAHVEPPKTAADTPWRILMPAFMVGELRRGFEMGFLLYLPFLVIDLVVSTVLMSLGMMMLPPTTISLPFKLIFFVMVDGWQLTAGSLVRSFGG